MTTVGLGAVLPAAAAQVCRVPGQVATTKHTFGVTPAGGSDTNSTACVVGPTGTGAGRQNSDMNRWNY